MPKLGFAAGCAAALCLAQPAMAACHDANGSLVACAESDVVRFINSTSAYLTISIDGVQVCALSSSDTCEARLGGGDADTAHAVHANMGNSTWDDSVAISECHWNWNGVKTYTFTAAKVQFDCAGGETDSDNQEVK